MRCDQCTYYVRDLDTYKEVVGVGQCTKAVMLWDATEWADAEEPYDCDRVIKQEHKEQMMFVQDGSDYSASLWTKPEFFCAHFTQK